MTAYGESSLMRFVFKMRYAYLFVPECLSDLDAFILIQHDTTVLAMQGMILHTSLRSVSHE